MKQNLTDRQKEILNFILEYIEFNGYPPTLREIGKKFDISSTFGVKRHLEALVKKGCLEIESNSSRAITITDIGFNSSDIKTSTRTIEIPIVGRVAAGQPILAMENIEGGVSIDSSFIKNPSNCFALRVKGDSMINAGIFENDLIIVSPNKEFHNGDIVVALIDGEATVKRFLREKDAIILKPENENYSPIILKNSSNFSIIGKILSVIRWYN